VTLDTVFERTTSERIFLKIDIEGSEYRIIDDILRYANRIAGIVIEFHDTDPLREVFETSVKKLQGRFEIAHLHMNNWGGIGRDGLPEVLELTLVKKAGTGIGKRRTTLPIFSVDSPNIPRMKDYAIEFAF
jgi:hypothetical protein